MFLKAPLSCFFHLIELFTEHKYHQPISIYNNRAAGKTNFTDFQGKDPLDLSERAEGLSSKTAKTGYEETCKRGVEGGRTV